MPDLRPAGAGPAPDPLLGALHSEPTLHRKGSVVLRRLGAALLLLGWFLGLVDRRLVQVGAPNWIGTTDFTLLQVAALVAGVGVGLLCLSFFIPGRRLLTPPVAEAPVLFRRMAARERLRTALGWTMVAVSALWAGYGVVVATASGAVLHVAGAAIVLVGGAALLLVSAARMPLLRRLLAQELLHGAGPAPRDARVGHVLRHLDALLGALPDETVRAFMAAPESALYLELLEEAMADGAEPWPEPSEDDVQHASASFEAGAAGHARAAPAWPAAPTPAYVPPADAPRAPQSTDPTPPTHATDATGAAVPSGSTDRWDPIGQTDWTEVAATPRDDAQQAGAGSAAWPADGSADGPADWPPRARAPPAHDEPRPSSSDSTEEAAELASRILPSRRRNMEEADG